MNETNKQKTDMQKESSLNNSKLIKPIWNTSFVVGIASTLFQDRIPYTEIFWVISISSIILAVSSILILVNKRVDLVERVLYPLGTIFICLFVSPHPLDIPAYLTNNYRVIEGVPTEYDYRSPRGGGAYLHIKVSDVTLRMPKNIPESRSDRWFVINYLPVSKFIMNYEILTEQETKDKLKNAQGR